MNSCANGNAVTKLRGSESSELREESAGYTRGVDFSKGDKADKSEPDGSPDFGVPRGTLVICQRNSTNYSADHNFGRFKPR